MAYYKNSPTIFNPTRYSIYNQSYNKKGTPLPPPEPTGDFLLLNFTPFLLLDGTNFQLL